MVPTLLHLHIPKCGGIGLKTFLADEYAGRRFYTYADDAELDRDLRGHGRAADALMISGHFRWGLHLRLERPCAYFIVLREPAARILSLFNFIRHNPDHRLHDLMNEPGMTIAKLYRDHLDESVQFSNGMCRQISGLDEGSDKRHFDTALVNLLSPLTVCGALDALPMALDGLRNRFMVGHASPSETINVAKTRLEASPADIEAIRDHNAYDTKLYSLVRAAARTAEPRRLLAASGAQAAGPRAPEPRALEPLDPAAARTAGSIPA